MPPPAPTLGMSHDVTVGKTEQTGFLQQKTSQTEIISDHTPDGQLLANPLTVWVGVVGGHLPPVPLELVIQKLVCEAELKTQQQKVQQLT